MGIRQNDGRSTPDSHLQAKHGFRSGMWQRIHHLFAKDSHHNDGNESVQRPDDVSWPDQPPPRTTRDWSTVPVGVGLPRQATFRRQNSEKRDRLTPVDPSATERRALSSARASGSLSVARRPRASSTPPLYHLERSSAPAIPTSTARQDYTSPQQNTLSSSPIHNFEPDIHSNHVADDGTRPPRPPSITSSAMSHQPDYDEIDVDEKAQIKAELDTRWILNLSMHFRDKSDREKFFVTYAETPNKWRRVTVSCDYRNAEPSSLEMDLKELQFQRDKSLQIYESIRDSLPEIQFYDSVTNLKLETSDGRLHVHVTEDVNETISYPPRSTVAHILYNDDYQPQEICESDLNFDSHLSGFVYKVSHNGRVYIKKEIPGPDTVDEFLYEINALHALHGSHNVIQLEAIVVDDTHQLVKGLLISHAEQGAVVDLLYDYKGKVDWNDRLRWAQHAVLGLSEIHDEGYVQGDFTLSNIVVDADGDAKIIDINRRGCPVGWEPPEIATKIASHQRISMYIGEKSDLYQLGMTMWGLAADDDEPERHDPPLSVESLPSYVPEWYRDIVRICLDPKPRNRLAARELAKMFPATDNLNTRRLSESPHSTGFRQQKRYIDPSHAVERDDIERFGWNGSDLPYSPQSSRYDDTFTYPRSSNYDRGSDISEFERPRGRAPPRNLEHLSDAERRGWSVEEIAAPGSYSDNEPQIISVSPGMGPQYDDVRIDGRPFLIARGTFDDEELEMLDGRRRERPSQEVAEPDSIDVTRPSRPPCPSRTSASGSTPRHSQAILPTFSGSRRSSFQAGSDPGTALSHPDHASEHYSTSTLHPLTEERRVSVSPHPPPSLSYADSGFYEPHDEEDTLPHAPIDTVAPRNQGRDQLTPSSITPVENSVSERADGLKIPPTLERSDTAIRVEGDNPSSPANIALPPSRPVTPVPILVVKDFDQSVSQNPGDDVGERAQSTATAGESIVPSEKPDTVMGIARNVHEHQISGGLNGLNGENFDAVHTPDATNEQPCDSGDSRLESQAPPATAIEVPPRSADAPIVSGEQYSSAQHGGEEKSGEMPDSELPVPPTAEDDIEASKSLPPDHAQPATSLADETRA